MPRLIDADAFRRELDNHWPFTKEEQSKHGIADLAKGTVLTVLGQMPTIEERKRGKWIEITDHETPIVCKCTECGWLTTHYDSFLFCPNCGADMRATERSDDV